MSVQVRICGVKICGLTNADDARMALEAGADYLGFVLYPRSPRAITPIRLARLLDCLDPAARVVGVFVNTARAEVESVFRDCRLHAVQLHGDEDAQEFAGFPGRLWRAVCRVEGRWRPPEGSWSADCYVVDSARAGVHGGTGVTGDWAAAGELAGRMPVFLAGGLNPDNVGAAIRAVRPLGVDTASGVEETPGRKNPERVKAFIRAARAASEADGKGNG